MEGYSLNIKLKDESHLKLLQSLTNSTIYNFIKRYCSRDKDTKIYYLSAGLNEIRVIDLWNYIWDSFNHIYNLDKYKELHYITIAEQNELFSMIMCIIDETIITKGNRNTNYLNDNNADNTDNTQDDQPKKI